ncbi:hypothetical protein ASPACDRAFT_46115 [Aspergillus aculeatus ATCC 16872]|uniref:Uncharacterized protein n=1 Tax=Aspergillus aculeatus (strain ATCC 16872 / CBS 172.66 / WB 5094) TaxID=690307 RepID=A0A1L9WM88_ASPA1|nr:uncharacterized protein ASPACDRAFT_46115 [Aspergillus aculeatus ATCC 16872]OJJ97261.1 hypothetical protein ASPACDRAFT_46115 [Aspergillus aculeatus ATCC 16872]
MQGELQGFLKRRLTAAGDADFDFPWPDPHPLFQRVQHLPVFSFIESVYSVEQKRDRAVCEYDLNLWLECELFGKPRAHPLLLSNENATRWTSDHNPRRPIRLMFPFLFPVLTACIGIPWRGSDLLPLLPAGEDYASWLTRIVPFSALTLNAIGSAQRQLHRAAAGFIELLELY